MSSVVEGDVRKNDDVEESCGELGDATTKEEELSQKVIFIPRPPPLFPQRLVKKSEDGKYDQIIHRNTVYQIKKHNSNQRMT